MESPEAELRRLWQRDRRRARRVHRGTAALRVLPDVLVVGAQKAGTTSLHAYLSAHPLILTSLRKEVHYFDADHHHRRGEAWYRAHFPTRPRVWGVALRRGRRPRVCESTPRYLYDSAAPARMAALVPRASLVALLRDPIERAASHHRMLADRGYRRPFEEACEQALAWLADPEADTGLRRAPLPAELLHRGLYARQLERLARHFPRERTLVLLSEDLFAHPAETHARVLEFLGLPPQRLARYAVANPRPGPPMPAELRARLSAFFEPHNRALARWLGHDLPWS